MPWNLHRFLIKCYLECSLLGRHIPICRHGFVGHRKNQPRNSLPLDLTKKSSNTLNYMGKAGKQRSMKFSLTTCIHITKTTSAFNLSVQLTARTSRLRNFPPTVGRINESKLRRKTDENSSTILYSLSWNKLVVSSVHLPKLRR